MLSEIVPAIQALGFDVYMRNPDDKHLLFVEGDKIGYLEYNRLDGLCLSTVHRPNSYCGTGFSIARGVEKLNHETLSQAFVLCPAWLGHKAPHVSKYKGIKQYRAENTFNAGYKLVPVNKGDDANAE